MQEKSDCLKTEMSESWKKCSECKQNSLMTSVKKNSKQQKIIKSGMLRVMRKVFGKSDELKRSEWLPLEFF